MLFCQCSRVDHETLLYSLSYLKRLDPTTCILESTTSLELQEVNWGWWARRSWNGPTVSADNDIDSLTALRLRHSLRFGLDGAIRVCLNAIIRYRMRIARTTLGATTVGSLCHYSRTMDRRCSKIAQVVIPGGILKAIRTGSKCSPAGDTCNVVKHDITSANSSRWGVSPAYSLLYLERMFAEALWWLIFLAVGVRDRSLVIDEQAQSITSIVVSRFV